MRTTILVLCVAALVGCEESTMVGSGCPNGACPEALVRDDDVCVVRTVVAEIAFDRMHLSDSAELCLPERLSRSEAGEVRGKVYFVIGSEAEPQLGCTDRPFLRPVSSEVHRTLVHANDPEAVVCEVVQLPVVASEDGGAAVVGAGEGFYYDDFSEHCTDPAAGRIVFTTEAEPWAGVVARLAIAEIRDAEGEIDETLSCEPLRGTEPVGASCSLPQTQYFDSQALIATNTDACGQGVCIAYHLEGRTDGECAEPSDPKGGVSPGCASPAEIEQRMYCTCRCSGPPGATDLCDCPDRFSCVEVVSPIAPSVAGGYCVRNTTVSGDVD